MSELRTPVMVSIETHREIVQDMRNDAAILRTQLDETLATNVALAERAAKQEAQIAAMRPVVDAAIEHYHCVPYSEQLLKFADAIEAYEAYQREVEA